MKKLIFPLPPNSTEISARCSGSLMCLFLVASLIRRSLQFFFSVSGYIHTGVI